MSDGASLTRERLPVIASFSAMTRHNHPAPEDLERSRLVPVINRGEAAVDAAPPLSVPDSSVFDLVSCCTSVESLYYICTMFWFFLVIVAIAVLWFILRSTG